MNKQTWGNIYKKQEWLWEQDTSIKEVNFLRVKKYPLVREAAKYRGLMLDPERSTQDDSRIFSCEEWKSEFIYLFIYLFIYFKDFIYLFDRHK